MKRFILILAGICVFKASPAFALTPQPVYSPPSISVSSVSISGAQAQLLISTPTGVGPYSGGNYNYISHIRVEMYAVSTLTGGATPVTCTSTNLQSLALKFPTAAATGTMYVVDMPLDNPIQSVIGSLTSITCPGTTNVIWNMIVTYYQGQ